MRKLVHMLVLLYSITLILAACGKDDTTVVQNTTPIKNSTDSSDEIIDSSSETPDPNESTAPSSSNGADVESVPESKPPEPSESDNSEAKDTETINPTLTVVSPENGVVVEGEKITIKLNITDFQLVDFRTNTSPKKGEGHVHAWLDSDTSDPNAAFKLIEGNTITFDKVPAGEHKLTVQLVENNHRPIQPSIKHEIVFSTKLTAPPSDVSKEAVQTFTINIENYTYSKEELTIPVGSQVVFVNKEESNHTATVDGKFNSGTLKKDESYTVTLEEAGEYNVYCEPHSFMKMKIIVEEVHW